MSDTSPCQSLSHDQCVNQETAVIDWARALHTPRGTRAFQLAFRRIGVLKRRFALEVRRQRRSALTEIIGDGAGDEVAVVHRPRWQRCIGVNVGDELPSDTNAVHTPRETRALLLAFQHVVHHRQLILYARSATSATTPTQPVPPSLSPPQTPCKHDDADTTGGFVLVTGADVTTLLIDAVSGTLTDIICDEVTTVYRRKRR